MLFVQPTAVDKAVLLWLNYKNTYEFWNMKRQQIAETKGKKTQAHPLVRVFLV